MNRAFLTDCAFRYFLGQALIIMIEDHVIQFAKSIGFRGSKFWRLIGVIWTVTIIGVTCQVWSAQVIDRGMWVHDRTIDVFSLGPPLAGH